MVDGIELNGKMGILQKDHVSFFPPVKMRKKEIDLFTELEVISGKLSMGKNNSNVYITPSSCYTLGPRAKEVHDPHVEFLEIFPNPF